VPLGLNVESVSLVKEEIDAAHTLFQNLQATLLNAKGSPWAVRWFYTSDALILAEGEAARALSILRREIRDIAQAQAQPAGALVASPAGLALSFTSAVLLGFFLGRILPARRIM